MRRDLGVMVMQEEVSADEVRRENLRMITEGLVCAAQIGHQTLSTELMAQWTALLRGGPPTVDASTGQPTQRQGSEGRSVMTLAETLRKEAARAKSKGRGMPGDPHARAMTD